MNYGPLVFLAAFFALASSWCGFVLTPQLQIGRLQQTNTRRRRGCDLSRGPARLGAAGTGGLSRQRLRLLPQPASGPDRRGPGYRAHGCGNEPGRHHRRAAQAGQGPTDEPAELDRRCRPWSSADQMRPPRTLLSGLPKAFFRSSNPEAANAAVKALNATSAKAQAWIVPVGPDLARGWGKRRTVAEDFLFDSPVMPGSQRVGPDLADVGDAPAGCQLAFAASVCAAVPGKGIDHAAVSLPVREAQDRGVRRRLRRWFSPATWRRPQAMR